MSLLGHTVSPRGALQDGLDLFDTEGKLGESGEQQLRLGETGKLKRFGIGAHQLRSEVARLMEWFRLSIRFGWIGSERRYRKITLVTRRGHPVLGSALASRIRRGLQLPYGRQAFRRGWAPTPDIPPPKNL